jgi:translation initiation factor 2B subunit (eIF-2B alpha/beta/delta family)
VVVSVLKSALQSGYQLEIFAVECRPTGEGIETYNQLKEFGSCKLIFDTAIGKLLLALVRVLLGTM